VAVRTLVKMVKGSTFAPIPPDDLGIFTTRFVDVVRGFENGKVVLILRNPEPEQVRIAQAKIDHMAKCKSDTLVKQKREEEERLRREAEASKSLIFSVILRSNDTHFEN
jgi:hypothetical protein